MKRFSLLLIALCAVVVAQAQRPMGGMMPPMGGMGMMPGMMGSSEKPFYEVESDSIVQACLYDLPFFLDQKTSDKFTKLVKTEYEEVCRNMQRAIFEHLLSNEFASMGGGRMGGMGFGFGSGEQEALNQTAIRETVEKITAKYAKKYKKMLDEEQFEQWSAIQDKRYGRGLGYLMAHVYENTSLDF